jgi:uroporphyrinogen-III synthase
MRILVTRPLEDGRATAARLERMGHVPIVAPLFGVRYRKGADISLADVQAVLITSANGIRALATRTAAREIPIFAVGARSAEVARSLGFLSVESAHGDADDLAGLIERKLSPQAGGLLHAGGAHIADHFGALEALGFAIRREPLYEAVVTKTPAILLESLRGDQADAALFFSPRASRIFAERIGAAGLAEHCRRLLAVSISPAAEAELSPLIFRETRAAARPDQDSMLALLPVEKAARGL